MTPEMAKKYHDSHEFWFIGPRPKHKAYKVDNHVSFMLDNKELFGFTQQEIDTAKGAGVDVIEQRGRIEHLYEVSVERGWIVVIVSKNVYVAPASLPWATFFFNLESPQVYESIAKFCLSQGQRSGLIRYRDIMDRRWDQPIESLLAKAQFSKSGLKQTCQRCGNEIGADELVHRSKCGRCGNPLW
jgi:hypothetical protein